MPDIIERDDGQLEVVRHGHVLWSGESLSEAWLIARKAADGSIAGTAIPSNRPGAAPARLIARVERI